jgi:hypothetical protein
MRELIFRGSIELGQGEDRVFVRACPYRFMRSMPDQETVDRYGALPFAITRVVVLDRSGAHT